MPHGFHGTPLNHYVNSDEHKKTIKDQGERDIRDRKRLCVETWTLIVGLSGLVGLWLTLKATRDAVDVTRRSIEVSQRAWLIATQFVEFKSPLTGEDKKISVPLVIENSGKTPAIYMEGKSALLCTRDFHKPFDWSLIAPYLRATEIEQFTLGPEQKVGLVAVDLPMPSGCSMEQVLNGQTKLLTTGYVNYWDEFGIPRGLLICGMYNLIAKRFEFCGHDNLPW